MIHLQYHIFNPKTETFSASYEKMFTNRTDFIKEYELSKSDTRLVMNVSFYNVKELTGQKDTNDIKLYSLAANKEQMQ